MKFFKTTEKRPFSYPTITEERKSVDRVPWIIGIILLITITSVIYFLLTS